MATHAPKLSKKESTVMLGDLLTQMKLKDHRAEMIDFVFKTSHIFSERHPERAAECWDENLVTHLLEGGFDVKGNQHFKKFSQDIHDVLEDIHYIIEDIVTEGSLKDGKITVRTVITGKWVKPVGETPATNAPISISGISIWKVKDGKMNECWAISHAPDNWKNAWVKLYTSQQPK